MALRKALLITDSPELRETVEILLADRFRIESVGFRGVARTVADDVELVVVDARQTPAVFRLPDGRAPVLWLGEAVRRAGIATGRRRALWLPARFDGFALREAAEKLAAETEPPRPAIGAPFLLPPFLTAEAAAVAARVIPAALPVLVCGEAGTGKRRVARAIHSERQCAYWLSLGPGEANGRQLPRLPAWLRENDEITVVVEGLEDLDASGARFVLDLLDCGELEQDGNHFRIRMMVTAEMDPRTLLREHKIGKSLFYRLNLFTIELPPLRERTADIPALVERVSGNVCAALDIPQVSFTAASLARLSRYLWFGNLAELEAVVARTIAFAEGRVVDKESLVFGYGPIRAEVSARPSSPAPPRRAAEMAVDVVINELAHEFRNPMVTIKTFAQRLDHLAEQDSGQDQVARLAEQAVERMDEALENLVQFTRFEQPTPQPTGMQALLAAAAGVVETDAAEKQLDVEIGRAADLVYVDPQQLTYALANLLRSVIREVSTSSKLKISAPRPGVVELQYAATARTAAGRLATMLVGNGDGSTALPLGMSFAKTLIERNRGSFVIEQTADKALITVELPLAVEGVERDGQAKGTRGRR